MWKVASCGCPSPIADTITPSCLRVERAIIFFRSNSNIADVPAIIMVSLPRIRQAGLNQARFDNKGLNRISRKTPAVTRVEECTRADTGVGAAIAAGSHAMKGIWALLVIAAINRVRAIAVGILDSNIRFHCPMLADIAIAIRIMTSPSRLVSAVIMPDASDFGD